MLIIKVKIGFKNNLFLLNFYFNTKYAEYSNQCYYFQSLSIIVV